MYLFLINPEAGNKRFARVEKRMKQLLDRHKVKSRFVMLDDLTNVLTIVRDNLRPTDKGIVVVGGNATVNAVINATVTESLPLGIVPMSKTNHLARSIGIKRWEQAIKMLADPELRAERLGKIGKHYFVKQIDITSRQNLLTKYLNRSNPLFKFLGLGKSSQPAGNKVVTRVVLDDELSALSEAQRLEVSLSPSQEALGAGDNDNGNEKRLRMRLFVPSKDGLETSLLHSDFLKVDGDTKMPVTMGNETIAFTPVEIKGLSKHIQLIVPKGTNGKLTESATP